jgi:hypothetical protein
MTLSHYLGVISAVLGAVGTGALFLGSWVFEPLEGGVFGSEALNRHNDQVRARNRRRTLTQRGGLVLLMIGFILQGIAALVP